ncbi:hypothetical protein AKJ66_00010 [candidate division MSBL1 archaeon SCGC-AAA259E22]|uniref:DUF5658 domain-containing protein n=1 Tax=candidate division MSBL1 archaeon SCGC-AAA259E22 TaxID=1698265 RepID=A0A133UIG8_9EURY|nr:hypothetical protein AKJ66_00010 [candidate division MSBL1 archaeon SCGC-AAA259E22]
MDGERGQDRLWLKRSEDGGGVKVITETEMRRERGEKPERKRYPKEVRRSEEEERSREKPSIRELTEQLEKRKRDLKRGKGIEEPPSELDRSVRDETKEEGMTSSDLLWIPAFLLYGFGDTASSFLVFGLGGHETNPLFRFLAGLDGGLVWFSLLKTAILVVLCIVSYTTMENKWRWIVPATVTGVGLWLVISNVLTILQLA